MPRVLKITWQDRAASLGGGTELIITDTAGQGHNEPYSKERLAEAVEVIKRYLDPSKFDAVPPPPPITA